MQAAPRARLTIEELEPRIAPTSVVIPGVPAYQWHHGCGPTAAGMILGYWDTNGYDRLVVGDAWDTTGNLANIHDMVATLEHYDDFGDPSFNPDCSEVGGAHDSNSVADFMRTSWSLYGMSYGWSLFNYADNGLEEYAQYMGYSDADATNEAYHVGTLWDNFVAESDTGNPVLLLVDADGIGGSDHFVAAIGYNDVTMEYACYNTWDSSVHWYDFALWNAHQPWAIYGVTYFDPGTPVLPVRVELASSSDTGVSDSDGITYDSTATVDVTVDEAGTISLAFDHDGTYDTTQYVGSAGTYSYQSPFALADGDRTIDLHFEGDSATVTDRWVDIHVDTVAPNAPDIPDLVAADDTGVSDTDNITSHLTPTYGLTGFGDYYRFYRDGLQISNHYDSATSFRESPMPLVDGPYDYTLRAVDVAGNESDASDTLTVTIDTLGPAVSSVSPAPDGILMLSPAELTAVFNEVLDPGTVTSTNFQLVASGLDGTFGDGNETTIVPTSVDYDEATSTATFHVDGVMDNDTYQISLIGTATIEDLAGNALDGDGSGWPGGDYTSTFQLTDAVVIDDGDPGYTNSGWTLGLGAGYQGDYRWIDSGDGSEQAEWTVSGLAPGTYEVYASWVEGYNRATDAPYEVLDGTTSDATVEVNQRLAPDDVQWDGQWWESLGTFVVDSGTLTVRLTDDANSYVIADAIYVTTAELPLAIDDGDSGYTDSAWTPGLGAGYEDDYHWMSSGVGSEQAEWTVLGLEPGTYEVYATWVEGYNRATDAPYEVLDGTTS